ncbi:MAG: hypothetical protein WCD79_02655 [Chthoniobacteraceae bacterium]
MMPKPQRYHPRRRLLLLAIFVAILSPLPYAGSWNDGSRLASVESLVDYHSWSIDRSIFVRTPGVDISRANSPYPLNDANLVQNGTRDKLFIHGHYYSDKSPVPSLFMAGIYKIFQVFTGLTAANNPELFCYLLTLVFSGGAYVVSVWCIDAMVVNLALPCIPRLLLPYSFALATIALPYTREVNNHILLLAVFSMVMLVALKYAEACSGRLISWHLAALGSLAGIGYTIDLGVGPVLVLGVVGFLAFQTRSVKVVILALLAAFPWFLLHHALNYMIGGTFKPANAVADYFLWPGSPFNAENLTGGWAHKHVAHFFVYALAMLFGKKGFIGHNLALYISIPAIVFFARNKMKDAALIYSALGMIAGTWLIYSATSNNYSGVCCSIRWFVPLLAPFYYLLAVFLKQRPGYSIDLLILFVWGLLMGILMWVKGPWMQHMVPGYWFIEAAALISWLTYRFRIQKKMPPISCS